MLIIHPCIYINARGSRTDALLVRDGRVVALGHQAREQATAHDSRVEPPGQCLFPALIDAHCHLFGLGMREGTLDLSHCRSPRDVQSALLAHPSPVARCGWVLGTHWNDRHWPADVPITRDLLDAVFPNTPVRLYRVDQHAIWVNTEALRRAAVSPDWHPPQGGEIQRDARGAMTGVFIDAAMRPVLDVIPEATADEDRAVFLKNAAHYRAMGLHTAHIAWMPLDRLSMLRELAKNRALPLRIHTMLDGEDPQIETLATEGPYRDPEARLSWSAIKFFADGALGSQGAALLEPYRDSNQNGGRGLELKSVEELEEGYTFWSARGFQVATHAIGDRAAQNVLNAIERTTTPAQRSALRPRLEHAQMLTPHDCQRLGDLEVLASIQPIHLRSDATWADQALHPHQLERLFPWRTLQGVTRIAAGSDFPIESANPWQAIATALTRRDLNGRPFFVEERLNLPEILSAYTEGAAWAAFWEKDLGSLAPGFCAEIIALDRDPFVMPANATSETAVQALAETLAETQVIAWQD